MELLFDCVELVEPLVRVEFVPPFVRVELVPLLDFVLVVELFLEFFTLVESFELLYELLL